MTKSVLFQKDILSAAQCSRVVIEAVFETADSMAHMVKKSGGNDVLKGKVMTALFYEPSSRTFGSFITAMQRLGGGFIPLQGVTYSSVAKGETLTDTVQTFANYSDVIVLRHPEAGAAKIAAEFCPKPLINAGDGIGEHPTQALLDLYTIRNHFSDISKLNVTCVGDLLNGRTVHSLSRLLSRYPGITLRLVSPQQLKLPSDLRQELTQAGVSIIETDRLDDVLKASDVLYITRVQKERFTDMELYEQTKHYYIIDRDKVSFLKKEAIIMHPFPRVGEITPEVDLDPRALYLTQQIENGMYIRMALLALVLKQDILL